MGFIEKLEQKSRGRNKKSQEDGERELRVYQENQDRLRLQKTFVMEEKKRLLKLRREAKVQFAASGLVEMLDRLRKARAIKSSLSESVVEEDRELHLSERDWEEMKIKDGSFRTKVIVSEGRRGDKWTYVDTERFFNIITDSTGLITFEHGTRFPRHREIQRSVWGKDPNLLEEVLEKAFKSPQEARGTVKHPRYSSSTFSDR